MSVDEVASDQKRHGGARRRRGSTPHRGLRYSIVVHLRCLDTCEGRLIRLVDEKN